MSDTVIINSAWGSWYPVGQQRLLNSLKEHGYTGDTLFFTNQEINHYFKKEAPYTTKAAALHEAMIKGYRYIIWFDCSMWAIKNVEGFVKTVKQNKGYFMWSGYNLAQTASDNALNLTGYTRDEAEKLYELASGLFAIDMKDKKSKKVAELFLEYAEIGVFNGSRLHANQSKDPRFLYHRQDQTALSLAFHKVGMKHAYQPNEHITYVQDYTNQPVYFLIKGM